jgi:Mce-associated membrane protein
VTGRHRRLLSYVLSAVLVLALALALVVTVVDPGASSSLTSTQESTARKEVQRVASAFAANVNTYSSQNVDAYAKRVRPLLTPQFERSFSRAIDGLVSQMRSTRLRSTGEVLVTGVSSVDRDSATVLVVSDADVTSAAGDRARHFRWEVELVRRGGRWLVDGFQPL